MSLVDLNPPAFYHHFVFLKKGKMDNHQKWMAKAIEEAIKSAQNGDGPIAALIPDYAFKSIRN